jgi:molecular chaperone GrpE
LSDQPEREGTEEEGAEASEDNPSEVENEAELDPAESAREAAARLKDQLLRMAADFENFRKRAKRDVEDAGRRAREQVVAEILPIVDNLERAVASAQGATDVAAVVDGVRMVLKSFEDVAERLQLQRLPAVGARFDPNVHDAIQQQETDEHPPGSIVAEVVPGYSLEGKLLRPAMVVVAKPPSSDGG